MKKDKSQKETAGQEASSIKDVGHIDQEPAAAGQQKSTHDNPSGAPEDPHQECRERINQLETRLEEANDKFLRLFSEFDNYRKRTARERLEHSKTAGSDIISSLLPVMDDLERAIKLESETPGTESRLEGIMLIYNKFKSILRQKGVEEIVSLGAGFDTDYHEAITQVPATGEQQKGTILEEVQKGYLLHGKVIRFARVVVAI